MGKLRSLVFLAAALAALVGGAAFGAGTEYDFALHTYPNPFIPFPGYEASIFYILPSDGTVSLRVYDFSGNLVRVVCDGEPRAGGAHERDDSWDGEDGGGAVVRPGTYAVVLEVTISGKVYRDSCVSVVYR